MTVKLQLGVPKNQRIRVAKIYCENFQDKIKLIFGNNEKAKTLIASSIQDDRILVALIDDVVVGFAGLQYTKKSYLELKMNQIVRIYGLATLLVFLFIIIDFFNKPKSHQLHLDTLAITSEEQSKGIGTKLLKSTINNAKIKKFSQIKLEVIQTNSKAKKLYKRIGFKTAKVTKIPCPFNYLIGFRSFEEMHYNLQNHH
jgi:ribosomal protein S18 acetylase RimI-like enzyme